MKIYRIAFTAPLIAAALAHAHAEVSRFDVLAREQPALQGHVFGGSGTVEKITARATIALDPADPHDSVIVDLDRAPRNADGKVEMMTDVIFLRPAHPNGTLLFEVLNRGRKVTPGYFDDTDTVSGSRLEQANDAGNGFLLSQGYTLAWAAWQGDVGSATGMQIQVPTVAGLTGPSREEWSFTDAGSPKRVTLSYPLADRSSVKLTIRNRTDDERQSMTGLAMTVIDDSTIEITRPAGAASGALYELTYTARDPKVMGMGLAAIRDVASFLRRDGSAQNPLAVDNRAAISRAIAIGISQSGRVLRDVLYFGMNQDEAGRIVFEGMMPIIPGARRSFTNARFAQPGRNPGPEFDRLFPVLQFPFTYPVMYDAVSGRRDGILLRCSLSNTCPRIMQLDSEFEFWGSQASLVVTDTQGNHIDLPPEVKVYLLSGAPHSNLWNAVVTRNAACALPLNPVSGGPVGRALLTAMNRWITDGVEPPSSRYPTRAAGTLVRTDEVYPIPIPGLSYQAQFVRAHWIEQATPLPRVRGDYPLFLPRAGVDGNAIAGIRQPLLAAPRATYTGWNPITGATGTQDLCTQMGGTLPFALTVAARQEAGDPRPSIEELYRAPGDYVAAVQAATERLVTERLLLPEDADVAISAARAGTLAKLAR